MAQIDLFIPDIGPAESIELVRWAVRVGEQVVEGQELCELVTDKAAFPLEAPSAGKLIAIMKEAGSPVKVGEAVGRLELNRSA
ncbi:MAG: hypothetical protein HS115_09635 [Spirochaetales bacterium]|nr:hypothetical protein [Spirochaetales bacterium]